MFLLVWTLRAAATVEVRSEQSKQQAIMGLMAGCLRRADVTFRFRCIPHVVTVATSETSAPWTF